MNTKPSTTIEAIADQIKWCVHTIGTDLYSAVPSHAVAVATAEQLNDDILGSGSNGGSKGSGFSFPMPWPGSDNDHAAHVRGSIRSGLMGEIQKVIEEDVRGGFMEQWATDSAGEPLYRHTEAGKARAELRRKSQPASEGGQ